MNGEMVLNKMTMGNDDVITKAEAEQCRHRLEKRWHRRLIELNIVIIAVVICVFVSHFGNYTKKAKDMINEGIQSISDTLEGKTNSSTEEKESGSHDDGNIPWDVKAVIMGIGGIFSIYIYMTYMYAKNKASALKITEQNFPEVYAIVCEQARKLGMKKVPEVYVIQANGVLNAFSTFCLSKQRYTRNIIRFVPNSMYQIVFIASGHIQIPECLFCHAFNTIMVFCFYFSYRYIHDTPS